MYIGSDNEEHSSTESIRANSVSASLFGGVLIITLETFRRESRFSDETNFEILLSVAINSPTCAAEIQIVLKQTPRPPYDAKEYGF